jgi:preprotein translocase subunit SecY
MATAAEHMASSISLANFAKASDLKKRLWFTLGALIVFRLLSFVPLPGIDPRALNALFETTRGGVLDFFNMFSGGSLQRMSLIALGVMPYITASIVMQLATTMSPQLGALKKEGESGRKKINQYTRLGTVLLCAIQGYFMAGGAREAGARPTPASRQWSDPGMMFRVTVVISLGRRLDVPDVAW